MVIIWKIIRKFLAGSSGRFTVFVATLTAFTPGMSVGSAPFCALRDPSHQIYSMYSEATNYRSVVKEVNAQTRNLLSADLPFSLHDNELGEHTLYVPMAGKTPLGIVHVRSEISEWGLVEIAWALTPNLKITDFRLQRCRGASCNAVLEKGLLQQLKGKGQDELAELLAGDLYRISEDLPSLNEAEHRLVNTIVQSAIKTIAVTGYEWPETVSELQAANNR